MIYVLAADLRQRLTIASKLTLCFFAGGLELHKAAKRIMKQNNTFYAKLGKRLFDLGLTIPCLLLITPVLVIVAMLIRFRLGSPVFFKQTRPGLYGKPFTLYKFRSMTDERDEEGDLLPNDQRLPRFGRLLRSTSLDELPELFNVLKGDMSLVGPRPLLMDYLKFYSSEEGRRHELRGGITGLAQIQGRNDLEFKERFKMDVEYVDNFSLTMDLKIILLTIQKVLKRESIVVDERDLRRKFEKSNNEIILSNIKGGSDE